MPMACEIYPAYTHTHTINGFQNVWTLLNKKGEKFDASFTAIGRTSEFFPWEKVHVNPPPAQENAMAIPSMSKFLPISDQMLQVLPTY